MSPLADIARLRKQGHRDEALARLHDVLRRGGLPPELLERAGRWLSQDLTDALHVRVIGRCTTAWLSPMIAALAFGRGMRVVVSEAEYDNVRQDLAAEHAPPPDVVVLVPWTQQLLAPGERGFEERIADEIVFWRDSLAIAERRGRVVQVGYDWTTFGPLGTHLGGTPGGDLALVREVNRQLRAVLPRGAYFVDLEAVSGHSGRAVFYDARQYHWTKQPFSMAGAAALAHHVVAGIQALVSGPKKVLVLDLDNTLWGGVVGELGPRGIVLGESPEGEAFRTFQRYVQALARRGVLLAVASKNNPDDAREPFTDNPDMVLAMSDLAAFEASWDPKEHAVRRIASQLDLGLDSFVFFDDNPAEREHIAQALPEVCVVDVPEEPADFVRALEAGAWFETVGLTDEDRARTTAYAVARRRVELQQSAGTLDEYLTSLEMIAQIRDVDDADLARVTQLLGKTNQFNLTTRRHAEADVRALLATPGAIGLTVRLRDRFGEYGLVAVLLAVPAEPGTLVVDTWLMSCRVIGRTVEQLCLRELIARAERAGCRTIVGDYLPTRKNALVAELYPTLGFAARPPGHAGGARYVLELPVERPPASFVTLEP